MFQLLFISFLFDFSQYHAIRHLTGRGVSAELDRAFAMGSLAHGLLPRNSMFSSTRLLVPAGQSVLT